MNITHIQVLTQFSLGSDVILVHTDLPDPQWPYIGTAMFKINAATSSGEEYVRKHFPDVPVEVIEG